MKGQIPGAVVGIFPRGGHREDVAVEKIGPLRIAEPMPLRRPRQPVVAVVPLGLHEGVELLRPQQPGVGLPRDAPLLGRERGVERGGVELVCLRLPSGKDVGEARIKRPA